MFHPGDATDCGDELAPCIALRGEHLRALRREAVVPAAALAGLLDPPAVNPPALLEAIEHGVERGDAERENAARSGLDQLAEVVAMARLVLDERQDQELSTPLFELAVEAGRLHVLHNNISLKSI